jgi:hypothetical protein
MLIGYYALPPRQITPEPASFTPTIDGIFNETEHWELSENIHCSYLHVDANHTNAYNYVYTSRSNESLYVLLDLCSDTTDDATNGEWISLDFDSDNSKSFYNYTMIGGNFSDYDENVSEVLLEELYINVLIDIMAYMNNLQDENGSECLYYNTTSEEHFVNFIDPELEGNTTLHSTLNYSIGVGFGNSCNSPINHRIYEFNITIADINNMTASSDYGLFVAGYGTMMIPFTLANGDLNFTAGFYAIPDNAMAFYASNWIMWEFYQTLTGFDETGDHFPNAFTILYSLVFMLSMEPYYLQCGNSTKVHDLSY